MQENICILKKTSFSTSSPAIIDFYSLTFILVPTQNRFRIVEIVSRSWLVPSQKVRTLLKENIWDK